MYIIWLVCYYIPVFNLGIYYTAEQDFTDSNYYDYYALKFCHLPLDEIIVESNITWQSVFVITFYSLIYKFFGSTLLNPIIINLILLYLSFYILKVAQIKKRYMIMICLLIPFMAVNLVVPGKDVIMIFLMSIYLSTFLNNYSKRKKLILKSLALVVGFYNRPNTLPIFLILEMVNFNNLSIKVKKFFYVIFVLSMYFIPMYIEGIMEGLGFENLIEKQRDGFAMSETLMNILLPTNGLLYLLVTPLRAFVYLIAPFPLLSNVLAYDQNNMFSFWFILFKFIDGFAWLLFMFYFFKKKYKYNPTINVLILLSVFISTVYLVQGGRYRVFCDLIMITYFSYQSIYSVTHNKN
ncbi:hypothetical protein QO200_01010 [Flavobacterium sp. Arc3]|uniref:hypothetical protein n=1 Tax=Flavobacterium sp. Arc3 TaxID=3046686 RepID=UPI00352CCCC4